MRAMLILILLICTMGLGVVAMTGCKEEKKSMTPATTLLLINAAQQSLYFPEIPKGVAE